MAFPRNVWDQLKATTVEELMAALKRDGFTPDPATTGAELGFIKKGKPQNKRVVIHYHHGKTWGPKFLKGLFDDIGWKLEDLFRVGLIKGAEKKTAEPPTLLIPCHCDLGVLENGEPCPDCGGTRFREVPAT